MLLNVAYFIFLGLCVYSPFLQAKIAFNAEEANSIRHFRAIPLHLSDNTIPAYSRYVHQDINGYLWSSGSNGLLRYDGYKYQFFDFQNTSRKSIPGMPYIFKDSKGELWVTASDLYKFDYETETFILYEMGSDIEITSITEDVEGNFWIFNYDSELFKYDKSLNKVIAKPFKNQVIDGFKQIHSSVYDKSKNSIWFTSSDGVYVLNLNNGELINVPTEIDKFFKKFSLRDITFDEAKKTLWVATPKGLLRINTDSLQAVLYYGDGKAGSLPISDVNVTYLDSAGNIWVGLEKKGVCAFRYNVNDFLCLGASLDEKNKLPVSTVEDISEDDNGTLWFAMNQYGLYRITPDLEKFVILRNEITNDDEGYFKNTFNGVVRENKDIWIATDGGGINVFNYETGFFSVIKHDSNNPQSLSSDSVISLAEDEKGYIWASTWSGGISKIDPETLKVRQYLNDPELPTNKTIAHNNVFVVKSDLKGGIWLAAWGSGLQYYNIESDTFTTYSATRKKGELANSRITHMQLYNDQVWLTGEEGFEILDINTGIFKKVLSPKNYEFTYVFVKSLEEVWLGTYGGLIKFNSITGETKKFTMEDGLSNNEVSYLRVDKKNRVWVATSFGISILNQQHNQFTNYSKDDGLVGDQMSNHGEFFTANGLLYAPSKSGMTIINPDDLPINTVSPKTTLSHIEITYANNANVSIRDNASIELPSDFNQIKFDFVASNFIFPENNRFKYRLIGLQSNYIHTNSHERFARFSNLKAGEYTFEVYGSNNSGVWDNKGERFSFTVLPAWWTTLWAKLFFISLMLLTGYVFYKWRFAVNQRAKELLELKVKQKTHQLEINAVKLKEASESLVNLNNELESRVEQRTSELQLEVNERKAAEAKLFHMAFHDSLTGLPNRQWIVNTIEKFIIRCKKESDYSFGVMFLDGDRFKQVNDTVGHVIGDQLLKSASKRLSTVLDKNHHVGRLGGDEFTVIAENLTENELTSLAQRIIDEFKKPFNIEQYALYFNVSIGVVWCDSQYQKVPSVLRNADIAMYTAKELGRNTFQLFDENIQRNLRHLAELEADLRVAVEEEQFELVYQPIINLDNGLISGFEALIRWVHPTKGIISPLDFIPIAEDTGLIWDIGQWVLREACKQTKRWHDMNLHVRPSISVNLSANQLRNESFLDRVDDIIGETGIAPQYIKLELTESILIENNESAKLLYNALNDRQLDLAIDDFGTGYSSLAYLHEIPVQFLKIDRCFVMAIDQNLDKDINADALEMVKAIISLGKSLRKKIIAEGIETETQLSLLIENGCDFVQGYLMAKPLSVSDATLTLNSKKNIHEGGVNIPKEQFLTEYTQRNKH